MTPKLMTRLEVAQFLGIDESSVHRVAGIADERRGSFGYFHGARIDALKVEREEKRKTRASTPRRSPTSEALSISRDELLEMRRSMSRNEIAAALGVNLSRVKRLISTLKLPPAPKAPGAKAQPPKPVAVDDSDEPIMVRAKRRLGGRLSECKMTGRYLLDGHPVRVEAVLRAANLHLNILPAHRDGSCLSRIDGGDAVRDFVPLGNSALADASSWRAESIEATHFVG
jgi:hypothetical protein